MRSFKGKLSQIFTLQALYAMRRAGLKPSISRFLEASTRLYEIDSIEEYIEYILATHDSESLTESNLGKTWTLSQIDMVSHGGTYEQIADPNNWHVKLKIREKASQLTGQLTNDVTLSRIAQVVNDVAGKLLVKKQGGRLEMVALARFVAIWNPDITPIRVNKALKYLLEQSGHSIVLVKGKYYLCDYALVPYPPPIST